MGGRLRRFLRGALTTNLELKFLALLLALALFYSREREEMGDRVMRVDVMTTGEDALRDRIRVSGLPAKIEITLRGPADVIASLRPDDVGPVSIGIRDALAMNIVPITREMFDLPDSVRVLEIEPSEIAFRFEPRSERDVPVFVELGPPAPDVTVDTAATVVDPPVVRVVGPRAAVEPIDVLRTERLELATWPIGTTVRLVRIEIPDVPHLSVAPRTVRVRVSLVADRIESVRSGIPVEIVRGTDLDERAMLVYGAESRRVTVTVAGLRSVVERLDNARIRLFARVDRAVLGVGDPAQSVERHVPIEVESTGEPWSIVSMEPSSVRVTYVPPPPAEPGAPIDIGIERGVERDAGGESPDAGRIEGGLERDAGGESPDAGRRVRPRSLWK